MKFAVLGILFYGLMMLPAVGQEWVEIKDDPSGVYVEMPKLPKLEKQELYTPEGRTEKTVYSTTFESMNLYFDIQALVGKQRSETKKFLQRSIDQTMVQLKGTSTVVSRKKKGDIAYSYIETPLLTGEICRSNFMIINDYLIHIYTIGNIQNVFSDVSNRYLETWGVRAVQVVEREDEDIPKKNEKKDKPAKNQDADIIVNWKDLQLAENLNLQLPGAPLKKTTFIENGGNDIVLTSYAYNDLETGLQYVVVTRPFSRDQGQLTNASIYSYYLERITKRKRLKLIEEEAIDRPYEGIEYTFSKGIRFYRMKLFRVNNVMYQFMVKGKRKQVREAQSEHFFNNIKIGD